MTFPGFCATRREPIGRLTSRQSATIVMVPSMWWLSDASLQKQQNSARNALTG
jgi:hypothetical protein